MAIRYLVDLNRKARQSLLDCRAFAFDEILFHRISQCPDGVDVDLYHIAFFEEFRRVEAHAYALGSAGGDDIARFQRHHLAAVADDEVARKNHLRRAAGLPTLAHVHAALAVKDASELKELTKSFPEQSREGLQTLLQLYGDVKVLDEAEKALGHIAGVKSVLQDLRTTAARISPARVTFDLAHARGYADWPQLAAGLEGAVLRWRHAAGDGLASSGKRGWAQGAPDGVFAPDWEAAMAAVLQACSLLVQALDAYHDIAPDITRLAERGTSLLARLERFGQPCPQGSVRWLDVGGGLRLVESPLDIADAMRTRFLPQPQESVDDDGWPATSEGLGRAWIFTSATLGHDAELSWFVKRCGLEGARILRVPSPFDYAAQAAMYVPEDFPSPSDPRHGSAVAALVANAAMSLGGRTLVLTTTLRAIAVIAQVLRQQLAQLGSSLEVLAQGEWPKLRLMERFRAGAGPQGGCILVASASFWEGFDVPGDALQLVVIDKLPFPPPGDPLVEARTLQIEQSGGSAFKEYALAEAALALKQGAGRLIRHESDRGVLVVCDSRLVRMGYGKRLIAALPPMRRLSGAEEFHAALEDLASVTRTSTTDQTFL